jgi:Tol biopolymer transport system component
VRAFPFPADARLGPYHLLGLLGSGGMGEVYKARDTRLGRTVAIKVLPEPFAADPDRRERFEREARAVAALNHPHICHLHDIGDAPVSTPQSGGNAESVSVRFLVMEYLEGQTLADRLVRGALPATEMLRYAVELADALDHAHRRGLVHRDLKPGNVMLTKAGAKLLDFGLSRLEASPDLLALSTVSLAAAPLTAKGAVLGTFPYMAPEQLAGREANERSDIFSFGALMYEMATGRRAFEGSTSATVIGAILHTDPPPLSSLQPLAPPTLDRLVSRCLAKDPDDRWQTARDLMLELKWLADHEAQPMAVRARDPKLGVIAVAAAAVAGLAIAALALGYVRRAPVDEAAASLSFSPPDGLALADVAAGGSVAISPDGQHLAFVAIDRDGRQLLWVRSVASFDARSLPETDGAMYPFWSPNNQFIGFFSQRKLRKIQVSGGPSQPIGDAIQPRGGTWNRDGLIVFADGAGHQLSRVSAAGGVATPIAADGLNVERYWPSFLPDGRHFVYFGRPQQHGIYLGAIDSSGAKLLVPDSIGVAYAPPGYLLVLQGASKGAPAGTLMAYPFDPKSLEITSDPSPVADQIGYYSGLGRGIFSVSENGRLVYDSIELPTTTLNWFDRTGKALGDAGGPIPYTGPSLSPDGGTVAVERIDPGTQIQNLWLIETARNIASRFTFDPNLNLNFMPVWSPDGRRIAFAAAGRGAPPNLYQKARSDTGPTLLVKSSFNTQPTDWSHDGRFIVYASLNPATKWDLWLLPMTGAETDRKPVALLESEYNEHLGRFSPDRRWLAYVSDESETSEVYVRTLAGPGGKWRISSKGGSEPTWRGDGKELFYRARDGSLMAVTIKAGATLEVGAPAELFKARMARRGPGYETSYTVTRDGQRFLMSTVTDESTSVPTKVVLNWRAALRR